MPSIADEQGFVRGVCDHNQNEPCLLDSVQIQDCIKEGS